jgi:uncharacterized membrane protein YkvA (DUF1232 family)
MAKSSEKNKDSDTNTKSDAYQERKDPWWRNAKKRAEKLIQSPEELSDFVNKASEKANGKQDGPLKKVWTSLSALFRLVKAYANGGYRDIPWQSLVMIVASLVYFVMPADFIPDFLVAAGYLDDVTVIGWTVKTVGDDIDAFLEWEAAQEHSKA